ncbi:glutamate 5-kinase [Sphingorhabdus lutea]|uniref:Glutamate 5-kinase n=1 Tax=Sphingorhabdus lutea TaxID=1913578 RepID=A0A1L3JE59_9SPHN|nr:glutamate 5-kinase [Sphingorhabdus lutea]APG63389.1 glutamate 5-kinase [Sphingorhabdus lutea]
MPPLTEISEQLTPNNIVSKSQTIVVKVGSALLINPDGSIRTKWLATLVEEIAALQKEGHKIIMVSSGTIALGARTLGLPDGGRSNLADAQAAASVGQIALARLWSEMIADKDILAAQILVTLGDLEDRRRYLNATATLDRLLSLGVIPVVNENDSVATYEIRFGDNDRLAARIGQAAEADLVILLSDVAGLYDKNPDSHKDAKLLKNITNIGEDIMQMADGNSSSGMGSGGMSSKLEAARIANMAGIPLIICSGKDNYPISTFLESEQGTIFEPQTSISARKGWLGGRLKTAGNVHIDAGAVTALKGGASLLPAGVTKIDGNFVRGDVIDIISPEGGILARGLAEYDAKDADIISGHQTHELGKLLGYTPRKAMVHRDQLVLL